MEKKYKKQSISKYFELTNLEHLHEYVETLQVIYNTPVKYQVVDNEIRKDVFGSPYVIFQYFENSEIEDKIKVSAVFHGVIFTIPSNLEDFDLIATKHINEEIKMIFANDYEVKDKENPLLYRLVIYIVPNEDPVKDEESKQLTPAKGK